MPEGESQCVSLCLWSPDQGSERQFTGLLKANKKLSLKRHIFHGLCAPTVNVPAQHELAGLPPSLCLHALMDWGHCRVVYFKWNGVQWNGGNKCSVSAHEKVQVYQWSTKYCLLQTVQTEEIASSIEWFIDLYYVIESLLGHSGLFLLLKMLGAMSQTSWRTCQIWFPFEKWSNWSPRFWSKNKQRCRMTTNIWTATLQPLKLIDKCINSQHISEHGLYM